jgi:hypothetical protein
MMKQQIELPDLVWDRLNLSWAVFCCGRRAQSLGRLYFFHRRVGQFQVVRRNGSDGAVRDHPGVFLSAYRGKEELMLYFIMGNDAPDSLEKRRNARPATPGWVR